MFVAEKFSFRKNKWKTEMLRCSKEQSARKQHSGIRKSVRNVGAD